MFKTITTEEVMKSTVRVHKSYECEQCVFKTSSYYDIKKHCQEHTYSKMVDIDCLVEDLDYLDLDRVYFFDSKEKATDFTRLNGERLDWCGPGWYLVKRHFCEDYVHDCWNCLIPLSGVIWEFEEFVNNMKKIVNANNQ